MTTNELSDIAACGLEAGAAARRAEDFRLLLQPRLRRLARDGDTATLDLGMGTRGEARLRELLRLEGECCPFWRFGVERRSPRRVRLTVSATPPFGDALVAFLSLAGPTAPGDTTFRAGEAAARAGVGVETLRYYERRGLLPRPRRRPSGQRECTLDDVRRILAIKTGQRLGFTLEETREIVAVTRGGAPRDPDALRARAEAKLAEVEDRIRGLELMRAELRSVIAAECDGLIGCDCADCPIDVAAPARVPAGGRGRLSAGAAPRRAAPS
ncbi:MAG TPA: MerR family transcriptional regulator [Miltoncostaea sp.]|nr:MerR family transcriptional regulator [Miltoncostaea sp.]